MNALDETMWSSRSMLACFTDRARVDAMATVEAALARAQASVGLIPAEAAEAISTAVRGHRLDADGILRDAVASGTPVVPLVRALRELLDEASAPYLHFGATSQDIIDTGLMLQARDGLDVLRDHLDDLAHACARLADEHRNTPMAGRTLLQQALPTTFGLKAARWLAMVTRRLERIAELRDRVVVVQLGGAVGTMASFGKQAQEVIAALANELGLGVPDLPWHAERDRITDLVVQLGATAGAADKIATDIVLLAQTEVAEVVVAREAGEGTSSTMPHKRNPTDAVAARSAARLATGEAAMMLGAMAHEHERSAGAWQIEWAIVPDVFRHTAGSVSAATRAVMGLEVDPEKMRANLTQTAGLMMAEPLLLALVPALGRDSARALVTELCRRVRETGADLLDVAADDERVTSQVPRERLHVLLDPERYLGVADQMIDRALAAHRAVMDGREST